YRGHPGGMEEGACLTEFLQQVSSRAFTVMVGKLLNHEAKAPFWVIIQAKRLSETVKRDG
ncbi:MAG: hypothetical protein FWG40_09305, partial [Peptococcaceae bacterium]|nr:hypothetical protein [Peptococcaceae bacterium]